MSKVCLVTGANGHLGNNLVKILIKEGYTVKAGVRNIDNAKIFNKLNCEVVKTDLMDIKTLEEALEGVDILFQVAAVFKHWSKNAKEEIYDMNIIGTKNIIEAAKNKKIKKIVYISSIAALDTSQLPKPLDETGWCQKSENIYFKSKTDSEKLAWELASKYNLDMTSVLPAGMIGGDCYRMTPTYHILKQIYNNEAKMDINFWLNYIDVKDVAIGCILAAKKGKKGERYILGSEKATSYRTIIDSARELFPERNIRIPKKVSRAFLMFLATIFQTIGFILRKKPLLVRNQVKIYYNNPRNLNINKAKSHLGFNPKSPELAIKDALIYLNDTNL